MPPTLSTLPAEIIYELADHLALPELNALLRASRLFYQQLNHTLHKRGLAMAHPTHRHEEGQRGACWDHAPSWEIKPNEPWKCFSANIAAWLAAGLDPNVCISTDRETLLHRAVRMDDNEMVAHLLACGANVNARTQYNRWTPLHLADSALVASALLRGGADPNREDSAGKTALWYVENEPRPFKEVEELVKVLGGNCSCRHART
jgi:hypothetical protein